MLFGEWDFEREKEVARQEGWQGGRQEERKKSLQRERQIQKQYQAQLKASSAQIQALQEEINRLREGR